jgi:uncharacterized protein (DUF302 family)
MSQGRGDRAVGGSRLRGGGYPTSIAIFPEEINLLERNRISRALLAVIAMSALVCAGPLRAADGKAPLPAGASKQLQVSIIRLPVKAGVSFDDAVDSLKLRANSRNFKFVGHSPLSKEVEAVTGKPAARAEIFSFCDAVTASQFLAVSLDFAAFLPCRVAIVEDADKKIWVVSMMMDMSWLETSGGGQAVPESLRKRAKEIIDIMNDMIRAAASGDI